MREVWRLRRASLALPQAAGPAALRTRDWKYHPAATSTQVELFCISKLINCVLETDEEFVCMDFHFAVRGGAAGSLSINPQWLLLWAA